jgi:hypothetical protein
MMESMHPNNPNEGENVNENMLLLLSEGTKESANRLKAVISCSICLEILSNVSIVGTCGHSYCGTCLDRYRRKASSDHGGSVCPLCKTPFECGKDVIVSTSVGALVQSVGELLSELEKLLPKPVVPLRSLVRVHSGRAGQSRIARSTSSSSSSSAVVVVGTAKPAEGANATEVATNNNNNAAPSSSSSPGKKQKKENENTGPNELEPTAALERLLDNKPPEIVVNNNNDHNNNIGNEIMRQSSSATTCSTIESHEILIHSTPVPPSTALSSHRSSKSAPSTASSTDFHTPTPSKQSDKSGKHSKTNATNTNESRSSRGSSRHTPQSSDATSNGAKPDKFQVGDVVDVLPRTWIGINKPGGAATIIAVHEEASNSSNVSGTNNSTEQPWVNTDATADAGEVGLSYDVKYILSTGQDTYVPHYFVEYPKEIARHQRRHKPVNYAEPDTQAFDALISFERSTSFAEDTKKSAIPRSVSSSEKKRKRHQDRNNIILDDNVSTVSHASTDYMSSDAPDTASSLTDSSSKSKKRHGKSPDKRSSSNNSSSSSSSSSSSTSSSRKHTGSAFANTEIVLLSTSLDDKEYNRLLEFSQQFDVAMGSNGSAGKAPAMTHLVVATNSKNLFMHRTMKFLEAIMGT